MNIDGKYYNGKSPVSINVSCVITTDGLSILNCESEEIITIWNREDIFHDENQNTALVIGNRNDKSKIEILNLEIAHQLGIEKQSKSVVTRDVRGIYKWVGLIIISGLSFWFSIPVITKVVATKIPYKYEVSASEKMKLNDYFKPCTMSEKQSRALSSFSKYLYPKTDKEKSMPVQFIVTKSSMVNAFTFPGGKIVLMNGLIRESKSPEELLGVMGHEIGHVVARDSAGLLVRGSLIGTLFGFLTGDFNSTFAISPQILLSTAALSFDRDMEKEADAYSAKRLNMLNVSTSGIRAFLSRRNHEFELNVPEILMTHPDYEKRISLIEATYPKTPLPKEVEEAWVVIKTICE